MISKYKNVAVIYGGKGRNYAEAFHKSILKISDEKRYLRKDPPHANEIF